MARILIVEDSPTQAEQLRLILDEEGFDAEVAVNAEAALARLAELSFDIVISDIVMPGLSGYDLCRNIKAEPAWKNIPVILLTTRKDPMDIFRGLEYGADNFYTKPYDPDRLINRIRMILHNKELRMRGKLRVGVEIEFFGKTFAIGAEKEQILDLLISTFEDIVQTNLDLEKSKEELASAKAKIEEYAHLLEGRVRTSEEKYRIIVDSVTEGIITIDERGIIESINLTAQSIFGYTADEVVEKNVNMLMPEPYHSQHDTYLTTYIHTGVGKIIGKGPREVEGRRKDGTTFPMQVGVNEMSASAHRAFVGVVRDLSSLKAIERQLRQAQKLEAIGHLAGGVAHDFNNLLTVILGNLELLERATPVDEQLQKRVQIVRQAAERGAALTHRLLAFSRQQVLEQKTCNVGALVSGMDEMLRRTLGEAIEFESAASHGQWWANIDESEFENALLNLAINARDAMPNGGKLTIEIGHKYLDENYAACYADTKPGDYVMVSVSDTGTGMSAGVLEHVFEPFFTTKEKDKGTGLGLSMVYGFIKQSGGHVSIYSEEGHGATVRMYLPLIASHETEQQDASGEFSRSFVHDSMTVLIVDDNPDVREIGISMLKALNCHVIHAENAQQALELLEKHDRIDVLFTDVIMPGGMSGVALAAEAQKRWPHLRILFCSGYADSAAVNGRIITPDTVFIGKPYSMAELSKKLQQVLEKKT